MNYDEISQMPVVFNILNRASDRIFKLTGIAVNCYTEPIAITTRQHEKQVLKKLVCLHFRVSWKSVISLSRKQKGNQLVDARFAYMYFAQKELRMGSKEAAADCNRTHAIALLAIKKVNDYYDTKDEVITIIDKIKNDLKNDITINKKPASGA